MEDVENKDGEIVKHPVAVWLSYGVTKLYRSNGDVLSVCKFRNWVELLNYYDEVSQDYRDYRLICFCHNFGYEFDYLIKNVSLPKDLLTNSSHSPIASTLIRYPNIQFRCSYLLSGYSLKKLGLMLNFPKGDSDYRTIFPYDKITSEEWAYCERDNDIVAKYITDVMLPEYKLLFNIPYTKTGRVRKVFQRYYREHEGRNCNWDAMPPENCINALNRVFGGGLVISNPFFTDVVLNEVHSYDITSSYPFSAISEKYPRKIVKLDCVPTELYENELYVAKVRFKNIRSKYNWCWLSVSKMEAIDNCQFFNGKLINGNMCERYVTHVDFECIKWTYEFEYEVLEYYVLSDYKELPQCYFDTIKEIGIKKQKLKVELKKYREDSDEYKQISIDYALAKNDFNSIYGMCVEKLLKPVYEIDENYCWHESEGKYKHVNHMKRNFLFGVFITAYSRRNLLRAIIENCPDTFVYADTDSIKFIGENRFKNTNKCAKDFLPDTPELWSLGEFEYEGTYKQFKTLGAKKYCYDNGYGVVLTVAGLPKNNEYGLKTVFDFKPNVVFKNCKLGKTYLTQSSYFDINEDWEIEQKNNVDVTQWLADNNITTNGGVGLYPTSYKLDLTNNDSHIIKIYREELQEWLKEKLPNIGIKSTEYGVMIQRIV